MFIVMILLALASMIAPRIPTPVDQDTRSDASWSVVLGFAHEHGLQFGTDLVFTYGPLGFLATPLAANNQTALRLAVDALLALSTAAAIVLLSRRLEAFWRWLLPAAAFFLLGNIYPRSDLLIEAAMACWALLAFVETGRVAQLALFMFLVTAAFGALVKITLLILAGLSVGWLGLDYILRGSRRRGLWLLCAFAFAFALGWLISGQNLRHLGLFLSRAISTSSGFNQAMGYEGTAELRWRGMFTAMAAASVLLLRTAACKVEGDAPRLRRLLLGAWSGAVVFLMWKHGFVRTDRYHAGFYFGLIPLLVLGADALPTTRIAATLWARLIALLCCFVSFVTIQSMVLPGDLSFSVSQPFQSVASNAGRLLFPNRYCQATEDALGTRRQQLQLPQLRKIVGQSSIDMFGCDQAFIVANNFNYRPRPVFQSYAAYNTPLMRLNEDFYLSHAAPEYVLFWLGGQDHKFPPLEDARTLRHLLLNYRPAGAENGFLLLKSTARKKPELTLLREGAAQPGERIRLDPYSDVDLWAELNIEPSLTGAARGFLYQPGIVRLAVWYPASGTSRMRRFRAPPPMLKSGFLISPILLSNEEVLSLYQGSPPTRPSACAIEFEPGTTPLWKGAISYRIFKLQNKLEPSELWSPGAEGPR